jgi:hypothetical protein
MFVPPPAVIVPDLTVPLSPAGLAFVALVTDGLDDLAAFERSVAGYVDFVKDAADEVADTLGSYRTAVSLHLPVDLAGLIDGLRPGLEACRWALASFRRTDDDAVRPSVPVAPLRRATIDGQRRRVEHALSGLLRTYEEALIELRDLLPIVAAPEYGIAYAQDVDILERVLDANWPEAVSVARTALSLTEASAALEVILAVPRSLYSDVPHTTDLVMRTLRDADVAGCRLVGHLIVDLVPVDAT